jgi:hypothetical protein
MGSATATNKGRIGIFSAVTWLLFLGLYLLMSAAVNLSEVMAGAAAASFSLFMVRLLGEKFKKPLLMRPVWFLLLWRIPVAMFSESWLLLKALFARLAGREVEGVFIQHDFPGEEDGHDAARRAYMTFGVCVTPNSYLVYQDRDKKRVLIRQLVGKELSEVDRVFVELP